MNRSTSSEIFRPRRARPALPRAAGSTRHGAHAAIDFHGACCTVVADLLPGGNMHRARQHAETRTRERRRSEEHTSELQSLMRTSYAVFCLKKKKQTKTKKPRQL